MLSMPLILVPLVFLIGACIGSFLNVVIIRSLLGEPWMIGRSHCDVCKRQLAWYELFPIISFIVLRGKCRTCQTEIDLMHPVVEFLTGSLFVWWWLIGFAFFQLSTQPLQLIQSLFWLSIGITFIAILISDLLAYVIPDWTLLWIFFATLAYRIILVSTGIFNPADFARAMAVGFGLLIFFLLLWLFTKGRGMGFGDVKFVFVLGVLLGWPNAVVAVSLAFLLGALIGSVIVLLQRGSLKTALPFGPFLITGAVIALVWGQNLVQWYQSALRF